MDEITTGGIAGGSGLVGAVLGWLGFKARIKNIETKLQIMDKEVRYDVTCTKITDGIKIQLKDIKDMNKEMRDDIKQLLTGKGLK